MRQISVSAGLILAITVLLVSRTRAQYGIPDDDEEDHVVSKSIAPAPSIQENGFRNAKSVWTVRDQFGVREIRAKRETKKKEEAEMRPIVLDKMSLTMKNHEDSGLSTMLFNMLFNDGTRAQAAASREKDSGLLHTTYSYFDEGKLKQVAVKWKMDENGFSILGSRPTEIPEGSV